MSDAPAQDKRTRALEDALKLAAVHPDYFRAVQPAEAIEALHAGVIALADEVGALRREREVQAATIRKLQGFLDGQ